MAARRGRELIIKSDYAFDTQALSDISIIHVLMDRVMGSTPQPRCSGCHWIFRVSWNEDKCVGLVGVGVLVVMWVKTIDFIMLVLFVCLFVLRCYGDLR